MLVISCPQCGAYLQLTEAQARETAQCPACKAILTPPARPDAIMADPIPASARPTTAITTPDQLPAYPIPDRPQDEGALNLALGGWTRGSCLGYALVGLLTLAAGFSCVFPACQQMQVANSRLFAIMNMKQIALACHSHHDTFKTLPTPKALVPPERVQAVDLSWRVSILPFIEQKKFFARFDQTAAWDAPNNHPLLEDMPRIYKDPRLDPSPGRRATMYQYFTGPNTLWPANDAVRFADITDGTSNTFLFAEAAAPVRWTMPADMAIQPGQPLSLPPSDFLASMADGSVRFIDRARHSDATLRLFIDPRDGAAPPSLD